MRDYKHIKISRRDRILTLTLNKPETLNAVDGALHGELSHIFMEADQDPDSDIIILTGAGKAFSAGGDIEHMKRLHRDRAFYTVVLKEAKQIIFSILAMEKPLIAKLNGHTTGFGATMALFCDIIFANEKAKIGDPHVSAGLTAGDGAAVIWPQLIGFARAKEYLMTGNLMPMTKAAEMGLINYAVPPEELDQRVDAFADELAAGAKIAISTTKMSINIVLRQLASNIMDACLAYETYSALSDDHLEALNAFSEGRKPRFTGK